MKHISLLIPEGDTSLSNIEATYKMFTKVHEALERVGRKPLFEVHLVGLTKEARKTHVLLIQPYHVLADSTKTDLIIIPAVHGDAQPELAHNRTFIPWLIT